MSLLVTGSIGVDTIETPFGKRENVIGGSAVYFSYAASFFTHVRLVGVVGPDYPHSLQRLFEGRDVDLAGLEVRQGSKSFRWHGSYVQDMNAAQTLSVDLNVLAEHAPKLPERFGNSTHVFLANTHPQLQLQMLSSMQRPTLAVADTMNLWIETTRPDLLELLKRIDGLVLNDGEAKLLTGEKNMVCAAKKVLALGPKFVVIKKGEHGSLMATGGELYTLPSFPTEKVVDPTGAGDSFAAGMMGYLASQRSFSPSTLRRAMAYGTVVASYTISDFSLDGLKSTTREALDQRYEEFKRAMSF
ncbi:MAG: PfkB family carbohydrate kinase [Tepidisphaeraceae bacterium]